MLRSLDALEKGFLKAREKSQEECSAELETMRQLIFQIKPIVSTFIHPAPKPLKKFNSLVYWNWLNFVRNCGYTLYLTNNGLYRNAYGNMRYILESIVQALYIDSRHPQTTIETKIHILSEVEHNQSYYFKSLIQKLDIGEKEKIKAIHSSLSKKIHPTVKTVKSIFEDYLNKDKMPTIISCNAIKDISIFLRAVIDVFLFLCIPYFSEHKEQLKSINQMTEYVKKYKLSLTSKTLKIKLLR